MAGTVLHCRNIVERPAVVTRGATLRALGSLHPSALALLGLAPDFPHPDAVLRPEPIARPCADTETLALDGTVVSSASTSETERAKTVPTSGAFMLGERNTLQCLREEGIKKPQEAWTRFPLLDLHIRQRLSLNVLVDGTNEPR